MSRKLYIEIINNESIERQLEAVLQYVREKRVFGTDHLEETKNYGHKVFTNKGRNHVSCKRTNKDNYSFKVWRGV
jgi:hypothetical protein